MWLGENFVHAEVYCVHIQYNVYKGNFIIYMDHNYN